MNDQIDNLLKGILQKTIALTIRGKTLKRGRLVIFGYVGNYVVFDLLNGVKKERVEVPMPFALDIKDSTIIFDYRFVTLADGDMETLGLLKSQKPVKDSKFYDTMLNIEVHAN
jgi:hypothetical protein